MILNTAIVCLALNVYQESRGESVTGQIAVAQVTLNRAGSDRRVCETVLAPKQFSWTKHLVNRHTHQVKKEGLPTDKESWVLALFVSQLAMSRAIPNVAGDAISYHEKSKRPSWRKDMVRTAKINNHIFYAKR